MGTFNASLRLPGDSKGLTAVVELNEGRLKLAAGEHLIGDWELTHVTIEPAPEGVRLNVEGEIILLDIENRTAFEQETAQAAKRKRLRLPVRRQRRPEEKPARADVGLSGIDRFLARSQRLLGGILPNWVFTRGGLVVILASVALTVIFADVVSAMLLMIGVIVVLVGGVTMLDSVIAAKVLRHRLTPVQTVIVGGSIFVAGLLVGIVG